MRKAQERDPSELDGIYTENHHIFPISIYGKNKLTVKLTYKEHIVAHHLLFKECLKRYGAYHERTNKMNYALNLFLNIKTKYGVYERSLALTKLIRASHKVPFRMPLKSRRALSEKRKGKNNPMYGRTGPRAPGYGKKGILSPNYGKKRSEKTRKKISESHIGEKNPMYGKRGLLSPNYGKQGLAGEKNPAYDHTKRDWFNFKTGEIERDFTTYNLIQKYPNCKFCHLYEVVRGERKHSDGWKLLEESDLKNPIRNNNKRFAVPKTGKNNPNYDYTKYNWYNKSQGIFEFDLTVGELADAYPLLVKRNLHDVKNKRKPHYRGWKII